MTISGAIRGRSNIYNHIESMIRNAQKSVVIATSSNGFKRKVEFLKPLMKKLNDKGVKIRIAAPILPEMTKKAKEIARFADVKNIKNVNARFVVVDGKEVLFMVNHDKDVHESYDIGIWVNTPFFASALHNMFNATWSKI